MLGILKVAVRMVLAGLPEKEVAEGLVNLLKEKYNLPEGETYHDPNGLALETRTIRLICQNTIK